MTFKSTTDTKFLSGSAFLFLLACLVTSQAGEVHDSDIDLRNHIRALDVELARLGYWRGDDRARVLIEALRTSAANASLSQTPPKARAALRVGWTTLIRAYPGPESLLELQAAVADLSARRSLSERDKIDLEKLSIVTAFRSTTSSQERVAAIAAKLGERKSGDYFSPYVELLRREGGKHARQALLSVSAAVGSVHARSAAQIAILRLDLMAEWLRIPQTDRLEFAKDRIASLLREAKPEDLATVPPRVSDLATLVGDLDTQEATAFLTQLREDEAYLESLGISTGKKDPMIDLEAWMAAKLRLYCNLMDVSHEQLVRRGVAKADDPRYQPVAEH